MPSLTPDERRELLDIAREAISLVVLDHRYSDPTPRSPALKCPGAAFITLRKAGELRGCIGCVEATQELYQAVADCASAAATRDHRFSPISSDELEDLSITISVLDPPEALQAVEDIEIGRHGLMIRKGNCQGVLLPQVATEMDLGQVEFLELTCRKAGLPKDAWRQGATVRTFTIDLIASDSSEWQESA
jgi:AmmeMemoRadiSam system protein A